MRRRAAAAVLAVLAWAPAARASDPQPVELRRLFPQQADVLVAGGGLSRLVLPPAVLTACRPDLSDLRLFDPGDKEVPFLVDAGSGRSAGVEVTQRFEPRILEAARTEVRRENGPSLRRETLVLGMPAEPPQTGSWVLIVEPVPRQFVARVTVERLGDGAPTRLVEQGSLFRIAGARSAEKLRLPLPPFRDRRLRIVLETEHSFWLEPALRLESARTLERAGKIDVPLEVLSARSEGGRTIVDVSRPRGIVPDLLRIETATRTFDRRIEVWDDGPAGAGAALATGAIFRVEGLVPVGEQELTLRPAQGDRLRVEFDDGDSPALENPAFVAVIRQPSLIFSSGAGDPARPYGTLRFGGGRAHAPRYDLAGLLPPPARMVTGKRAQATALLYDDAAVRPAHLGDLRPNPDYDRTPALAFAMHPGAALDRRLFSHLRSLDVPASAEGLSRLRIEPADLAVLSDDLSDLRVADGSSRQWPYLVDREATTDLVRLEIEGPATRNGTSRYAMRLPVSPVRFDRLILDTGAKFFDRAFRLEAKVGDSEETTILQGRLARPVDDPRPVTVEVPPVRAASLALVVEDGDDAPLAFRSAQIRVPLPAVYLTAPEGRYALLLGAPDHDPPRYELERVRDVVLAVHSAPIAAGSLEANRDYSLQARLKGRGYAQTALLWTALSLAVVVLVILTLRLARRESPSGA